MMQLTKLNILLVCIYYVVTVSYVCGSVINHNNKDSKSDDLVLIDDAQKPKMPFEDNDENAKNPTTLWFASPMGKLNKRSFYDSNAINQEEYQDTVMDQYSNVLATPQYNDLEKMRLDIPEGSQWIVYLLAEKLKKPTSNPIKFLTPRLGRDPGDNEGTQRIAGNRPPFAPRLGRSNLFSPRLGRQAPSEY